MGHFAAEPLHVQFNQKAILLHIKDVLVDLCKQRLIFLAGVQASNAISVSHHIPSCHTKLS